MRAPACPDRPAANCPVRSAPEDLQVPVNVCGVAAGILVFADAGCFDG
jgi:hypothetical protein